MLSEIGTFLRDYLYMQNENVRNSCFVVSNEVVDSEIIRECLGGKCELYLKSDVCEIKRKR